MGWEIFSKLEGYSVDSLSTNIGKLFVSEDDDRIWCTFGNHVSQWKVNLSLKTQILICEWMVHDANIENIYEAGISDNSFTSMVWLALSNQTVQLYDPTTQQCINTISLENALNESVKFFLPMNDAVILATVGNTQASTKIFR